MNISIDNSNKKRVIKKNSPYKGNNINKEFNNDKNYYTKDIAYSSEEKRNNNYENSAANLNPSIIENIFHQSIKDRKLFSKNNSKKIKQNEDNISSFNYNDNHIFLNSPTNINHNAEPNNLILNECNKSKMEENSIYIKRNRLLIKYYKNWEGCNYFKYKGHIIEGPCSFRPTLMTGCAMTIPLILFLLFDFQYMKSNLSIFIPIIITIIYVIDLIFILLASFSDPGIIRRFSNNNKKLLLLKRKEIKIFHLGYITNYKYCPTCLIIRPNRSTHCMECDNCVERLDHHCPWLGHCIGKRNYTFFFVFLTLLNILCILILSFCIIHIIKNVNDYLAINNNLPEEQKFKHLKSLSFCDAIVSFYLIIYCFFTMCFITGLLLYHIKLILNNTTTKEELKKIFKNSKGNPYKRNICSNIKNVLFPIVKKYSLLDILRGEAAEISDSTGYENKFYKKGVKLEENETQQKLDNNIVLDEFNIRKNDSKPINEDFGYDLNMNNYNNIDNSNYYNNERFINSSTNINIEEDDDRNESYFIKNYKKQSVGKYEHNIEIKKLKIDKDINFKSVQNDINHQFKYNDNSKNINLEEYLKNFGTTNKKL